MKLVLKINFIFMSEQREGAPQVFGIDVSNVDVIPLDGKHKGQKLSPNWRSFDTFDQRTTLTTPDGSIVPVKELEGTTVKYESLEEND